MRPHPNRSRSARRSCCPCSALGRTRALVRSRRHRRSAAHLADERRRRARRDVRDSRAQGTRRHVGGDAARSGPEVWRNRVPAAASSRRRAGRGDSVASHRARRSRRRSRRRWRNPRAHRARRFACAADVSRITVTEEGVTGVVLASGDEIAASTVLSTLDPRARFTGSSIPSTSTRSCRRRSARSDIAARARR